MAPPTFHFEGVEGEALKMGAGSRVIPALKMGAGSRVIPYIFAASQNVGLEVPKPQKREKVGLNRPGGPKTSNRLA